MRFLSNFGCKIPSHCLREALVTSPLSASGLLCLKTDLNFAFRNISATHTWRVVDKKWLISHVHTKCNPTSDFSVKALNNCENLGIKYVQQSESSIKHRIYFTVEFQELLQIFWKTWRVNSLTFELFAFAPRPTLSKVEYSPGYLLFISYSTICFWIDWVRVYEYTKSRTSNREKLHHCQSAKTR